MSTSACAAGEPLLEELPCADRVREVFGEIGIPLEPWEALSLVRSEGGHLRQELDRVVRLRAAGRAPRPGFLVLDGLARLRETHGRLVRGLRALLARACPAERLETLVALAVVDPDRRAAASRWVAGEAPAPEALQALLALGERCSPVAPDRVELPPGVDRELFGDLLETRRFLRSLDGHTSRVEPWEVLCLAVENRAGVSDAAARLRSADAQSAAPDHNADLVRLLERLLELRFRWTPLVRGLARLVRRLPIGRYGRETIDLALAFTLASPEGRERARQWLSDPVHFRREAAIRLEGVIGRAQKYLSALRTAGA
jgi:hypothetical protein